MSVDLIVSKLVQLGLRDKDGEGMGVGMVGPLVVLGDGAREFYADPREVWRAIKVLHECTAQAFWDRSWLKAPSYDSLAEVWESLNTPQLDAAERLPRSSDYATVGRLRHFGPRTYLLQTESGEYGVVDEKQTSKWRLTPLE